MKLKNKKTGEIIEKYPAGFILNSGEQIMRYNSLAELNEEWKDYEEPKKYWYIDADGNVMACRRDDEYDDDAKSIGNYFSSREEAEKAVEKLKAWKRLEDRHFKFDDYDILNQTATWLVSREYDQYENDIKLLFGGEE